ncbi:MAG TPA: fibronectin type III domain-containing protein [Verrucomicrobiae bacterium]|nr:fibronectin type III domain-containing protein [Verrucomicrobiae bacterium]
MKTSKNLDRLCMTGRPGFFWALIASAALSPSAYSAQSLTLAWDPSASTNVTGYNLYYGQVSGGPTNTINAGLVTTSSVPGLQEARTYFFFVKAYSSTGTESDPSNLITYTVPGQPLPPVFLPFEAESGTLASPMAVGSDQNASGGQFITTSTAESGTATYAVDIPTAGDYVIWCRVLSPDSLTDSFYVSADGGAEDIYDTALNNTWAPTWQWTAVNGRNSGANPRLFQFGVGRHTIALRGREANTAIDQILITNDPSYVPDVIFTITTPNANISSITLSPPGAATLTWPSIAGKTYRVVYKTSLSDPVWTALVPDVNATGATASKSDYVVGNRFYGVIQLP